MTQKVVWLILHVLTLRRDDKPKSLQKWLYKNMLKKTINFKFKASKKHVSGTISLNTQLKTDNNQIILLNLVYNNWCKGKTMSSHSNLNLESQFMKEWTFWKKISQVQQKAFKTSLKIVNKWIAESLVYLFLLIQPWWLLLLYVQSKVHTGIRNERHGVVEAYYYQT